LSVQAEKNANIESTKACYKGLKKPPLPSTYNKM